MRILKIILVFIAILIGGAFGTYSFFTSGLPSLESLQDYQPNLVTKVYSNDGQIVGEFYIERRVVVSLNKIPPHLIKAFLAAEDSKFFEHEGISYVSIFRAFYKNLLAGRVVQGGSTITQQVAKSFFLTPERTISRKLRELIMAYRIEKHLNKDEILNLYLNQIYFGNGSYGIQTAAESYFGKNVEELNIAESAMLAGLPKAPSKYSPYANYGLAKKRQEFILSRMAEEKFITKEEADSALREKLKLKPNRADTLWVGPYFTEHVRRYIEEKYGEDVLYRGGLTVYTTLDVAMQDSANQAVSEGLREHDKRRGYRGPVSVLKTKEEIDSFLAEEDKRLSVKPLETGSIYRAVVTSVKDNTLNVSLGNRKGVIATADLEWAKHFNNTENPDGGVFTEIKKIFHSGDVVEVMIKSVPAKEEGIIPLKLEQEPLAEASLIAIEPETGFVKAMVGGSDFSKTQFNRAIQAERQPGSAFKPLIYTAALDKNFTPATIVMDSPLVFGDAPDPAEQETPLNPTDEPVEEQWRPGNYDEEFTGPTTIREAVARSRNIITIKVLKDIGIDYAITYAKMLGINSPLARDLTLALGSSAVSLMELTTAYTTLANEGMRPEPIFITKIEDRFGAVLEENKPVSTMVISQQTAYIITSLLQGVIEHGTGARARSLGRPAAGKTGTTNNLNDAWFIGYVPGLTAGTWVGYDGEKPLGRGETGGVAALPIWLKFMKKATIDMPVRNFAIPEGIEFAKIDPQTGQLATSATTEPLFEVFKAGTAPVEESTNVEKTRSSTDFFMMDTDSAPEKKQRPEAVD